MRGLGRAVTFVGEYPRRKGLCRGLRQAVRGGLLPGQKEHKSQLRKRRRKRREEEDKAIVNYMRARLPSVCCE